MLNYKELICIGCHYRWYANITKYLQLRRLPCPKCKKDGLVILTGEELK